MFFSFEGKRLQYYTGQRCDLSKWDPTPEVQRVKKNNVNSKGLTTSEINEILDDIKAKVITIYKQSKILKIPVSISYMRKELNEQLINDDTKTAPKDKYLPFLKLFDSYIEGSRKDYSHAYIKQLKSTKNHLEKYAKKKNISLTYNGINESFFQKYRDYFNDELGNTDNSFAGQIRRIKNFMKWATERRKTGKNLDYNKYKAKEEYLGKVIYLSWKEFQQLGSAKIESKHLQVVRDIFIFQSMTGMRYDDLTNLKKENLADNCISYSQRKTKLPVEVPYNKFTLKIKKKYINYDHERPLPVMTNQVFNRSLKDLFKEAKLNRVVEVVKKKGNEEIKEFKALHELASSHMARRNFVGISIEKKIRSEVIKSITGHSKDSKSFGRYYDISLDQKDEAMKSFK